MKNYKLFVLQSLEGNKNIGESLKDSILRDELYKHMFIEVYTVQNSTEWDDAWDKIYKSIDKTTYPVIQLFMHGDKDSIYVGNDQISTSQLLEKTRVANELCVGNLLLIASTGNGDHIASNTDITKHAPYEQIVFFAENEFNYTFYLYMLMGNAESGLNMLKITEGADYAKLYTSMGIFIGKVLQKYDHPEKHNDEYQKCVQNFFMFDLYPALRNDGFEGTIPRTFREFLSVYKWFTADD